MTTIRSRFLFAWLVAALLALPGVKSPAQTNFVTGGNGVNYTINGASDPTLTLQRGVLYVFSLSGISGHPFWIKSFSGSGGTGRYDVGVTNNGATGGTLFFSVSAATPNQLIYQCVAPTAE